jgi:FixJ family two-component response regulator
MHDPRRAHARPLWADVQSRLRAAHIEVPVVFITASDDLAPDQMITATGGVRLLRKPFSNDELLEAVGMALLSEKRDPT